jgi:hypothetical protein
VPAEKAEGALFMQEVPVRLSDVPFFPTPPLQFVDRHSSLVIRH